MKICYVCPDLGIPIAGTKGAAAHVRGLVRAFVGAGCEVLVLSPLTDGCQALGARPVPIPVTGLHESLAPDVERRTLRALRHVWSNVCVESALAEVLRAERPDLVYERYSPFGVAGSATARAQGVPHLLEVNAPLAREGAEYRRQGLPEVAAALEAGAFSATSRIVAVSRELRDELVENGVDPSKIAVVPNGVDPALFRPDGERFREGIEAELVVGFAGSLKAWHGVGVLVEAFRKLAADPRFHLLVVGDGPEARRLEALREELPGRVTLSGAVDHARVPAYLRGMDVAVAPYPSIERFYFSPLKVLEYMAAGRAVVASRIGQLAELVRDGETGLLVPAGDATALAEALRRLAREDGWRAELGQRAAAEVAERHTWACRASEILHLARSLA